jgi:hypothetical protein
MLFFLVAGVLAVTVLAGAALDGKINASIWQILVPAFLVTAIIGVVMFTFSIYIYCYEQRYYDLKGFLIKNLCCDMIHRQGILHY